MNTPLQTAAQQVIDQWDAPLWKNTISTAHFIGELRKALKADALETNKLQKQLDTAIRHEITLSNTLDKLQAQAVEPKLPELFSEIEWLGNEVRVHVFQRRADQTPLNVHSSTHPAPPLAGERAELIHWLRERSMWDGMLRLIDAANMLEADAQEIERKYISPVRTVADLANNLLIMDQDLPIYGAQYIDHPKRGRCAIAVSPTVSHERVQDARWIGQGSELNAAVVWTRAAQQVAVPVPMTDSEIDALGVSGIEQFPTIFNRVPWGSELKSYVRQLTRAIEAHHGIGAKPQHNPDWSAT